MKLRVPWIDVARCIGIFAIYLGHLADPDGQIRKFVFMFHVPLFFFLAGCTERFQRAESPLRSMGNKVKSVLVPWLLFCTVSLAVEVVTCEEPAPAVLGF